MDRQSERQTPYGPLESESAADWFDRRAAQAEALTMLVHGEAGTEFRNLRDDYQESTLWLLSDLVTELRHAHEAAMREERVRPRPVPAQAADGGTTRPSPFRT